MWAALSVALNAGCGKAEAGSPAPPATGGSGAGSSGSGGTSSGHANSGDTGAGGTHGSDGGAAGAPPSTTTSSTIGSGTGGSAGAAGAAGSASVDTPLTCADVPHEDPGEHCEAQLRAIVSSREDLRPLLTFEYDAAGRLASVGDHRSHDSYFVHRYTYDDAGRLARFEDDCTPLGTTEACQAAYEFSYAEAGWLQTMTWSYEPSRQTYYSKTYDEHGKLVETLNVGSGGTNGITYYYRSDDQRDRAEPFTIDENGTRIPGLTRFYEYGDDELLDEIACEDVDHPEYFECRETYRYTLEDGRVRTQRHVWDDGDLERTIIFDDLGLPAFGYLVVQGSDRTVYALLEEAPVFEAWEGYAYLEPRYPITPPHQVMPYRPYDLTRDVIGDFSYEHGDIPFSRRVTFSEDGLLERVKLGWHPSYVVEVETLRCGGAALETITVPDDPAALTVYYYGCDDFVLPPPPPGL